MNGLLDRVEELAALERAWAEARRGRPQLAVMWGRRRLGKTFLAAAFARGKRTIFFGSTEQAEHRELERFAGVARASLGERSLDGVGGAFRSWETALRFCVSQAEAKPLLLVIDEATYLEASTPGFASVVQVVWDHIAAGAKLMIVLVASAVGAMQRMIGGRGALMGRPTLTLALAPVALEACADFLPDATPVQLIEAYAACGGYPIHLLRWSPGGDTRENLRALCEPGGVLHDDLPAILRAELSASPGYPRILSAVGRGRSRYSEIASDAGQQIDHPLDVLIQSGFVRRSRPVGAPRGAGVGAGTIYQLDDPYLAFWWSVLYPNLSEIDAGGIEPVLNRVQPLWRRHVASVFEEQARAHARRLVRRGELPQDLVIGRWWSVSGEPCEVDVLGLRGNRTALIGEARWSDRALGLRERDELVAKRHRVPRPEKDPILAVWGRAGGDRNLRRAGVLVFDAADIVAR